MMDLDKKKQKKTNDWVKVAGIYKRVQVNANMFCLTLDQTN